MLYVILKFYCKKGAQFELDTIIQCSTEIHSADACIAYRIIIISFGHFRLQMTSNLHNSEIDVAFQLNASATRFYAT